VDSDPARAARSAALFLWGLHNRVNVRLAPQWGLSTAEVLYPSVEACPSCRSRTAAGSKYVDRRCCRGRSSWSWLPSWSPPPPSWSPPPPLPSSLWLSCLRGVLVPWHRPKGIHTIQ
jgi:hypothetical protein